MCELLEQLADSAKVVETAWSGEARIGIVLGSGLNGLASLLETQAEIPGDSIPGFPPTTAIGHRGRLLCGELAGVPTLMLDGRSHAYEGCEFNAITFPVRLMLHLGVRVLIVSNAAGAVNPEFQVGDIMIIDDHINLMWGNPLRGPNDERVGPRFPDLVCPYDPQLAEWVEALAEDTGTPIRRGTYMAMAGPNYETRAEYRMARQFGADVVGMSTVPEVLVAVHQGVRVLGLSVVSNVAVTDAGSAIESVTGEHVLETVSGAAAGLQQLVVGVATRLQKSILVDES